MTLKFKLRRECDTKFCKVFNETLFFISPYNQDIANHIKLFDEELEGRKGWLRVATVDGKVSWYCSDCSSRLENERFKKGES